MVPKKEIHKYIVKVKVNGTNQTTTVLRYSIGGLEETRGTCHLLRCIYVLPRVEGLQSPGLPAQTDRQATDRQTDRQTDKNGLPPFNPPL